MLPTVASQQAAAVAMSSYFLIDRSLHRSRPRPDHRIARRHGPRNSNVKIAKCILEAVQSSLVQRSRQLGICALRVLENVDKLDWDASRVLRTGF